mmetsp:Transcript_38889/g.123436  ORF Transcript_38889/g.123436 Transcript_38889/m.123436 type:complete len:260 (+) Transcript_38889:62-841(+)
MLSSSLAVSISRYHRQLSSYKLIERISRQSIRTRRCGTRTIEHVSSNPRSPYSNHDQTATKDAGRSIGAPSLRRIGRLQGSGEDGSRFEHGGMSALLGTCRLKAPVLDDAAREHRAHWSCFPSAAVCADGRARRTLAHVRKREPIADLLVGAALSLLGALADAQRALAADMLAGVPEAHILLALELAVRILAPRRVYLDGPLRYELRGIHAAEVAEKGHVSQRISYVSVRQGELISLPVHPIEYKGLFAAAFARRHGVL